MGVGNSKQAMVKKLRADLYCAVRLGGMGVAIGCLLGEEVAELMLR